MKQERYDSLFQGFYENYTRIHMSLRSIRQSIDFGTAMPKLDGVVNFAPFKMFGTLFHHDPDPELQRANAGVIHRFGSLLVHFELLYKKHQEIEALVHQSGEASDPVPDGAIQTYNRLALEQQFLFDDIVFHAHSMFDYLAAVVWRVVFKHWRMSVDPDKVPANKNLPKHIDWMKVVQFARKRDKDSLFQAITVDDTITGILDSIKRQDDVFVSSMAQYRNVITHSMFDLPFDVDSELAIQPITASKLYMSTLGAPGVPSKNGKILQVEAAASIIDRSGQCLVEVTTEISKVLNIEVIWREGFRKGNEAGSAQSDEENG